MSFSGMNSASASSQTSSPNNSNIINQGMLANSSTENQASEMSPADSAISSIGGLIVQLNSLSQSYSGVGDAELQVAKAALQKYMEKVVGSLNSAPNSSGGLISPSPSNSSSMQSQGGNGAGY